LKWFCRILGNVSVVVCFSFCCFLYSCVSFFLSFCCKFCTVLFSCYSLWSFLIFAVFCDFVFLGLFLPLSALAVSIQMMSVYVSVCVSVATPVYWVDRSFLSAGNNLPTPQTERFFFASQMKFIWQGCTLEATPIFVLSSNGEDLNLFSLSCDIQQNVAIKGIRYISHSKICLSFKSVVGQILIMKKRTLKIYFEWF
jgi:hypothetical protein